MSTPVYKIETLTGDTTDHTITSEVLNIYTKELVTDGIGHFSFVVPTVRGSASSGYKFDDIALNDTVNIYIGYDSVPATPLFIGKVGRISAPLTVKGGYIRVISGLSQGEILLRRFKTNTYEDDNAHTIVRDWANDLGILNNDKIPAEFTNVELEIKTKTYFDLLRWISDYWASAGTQLKKDFWVDLDNELVWDDRPLRTAGVETFTVGQNIKSYNVVRDIEAVKNNITVYGAAEQFVPSDQDDWTEPSDDPPSDWTATTGDLERGSSSPQVGTYYVTCRCADPAGQTVDFYRSITQQTTRNINKICFYHGPGSTCTDAEVRIYTPDSSNYFKSDLATAAAWAFNEITVGSTNEYDSAKNPNGDWTEVGTGNWYDMQGIAFYGTFSGSGSSYGLSVDGLYLYPERFSDTASDATSQSDYGQRDMEHTDDKLHSDSHCQKRSETLLYQLKDPPTQITITVDGNNNVLVGDRLSMTIPAENISSANYDVFQVEHVFEDKPRGWQTTATMVNSANTRKAVSLTQNQIISDLNRRVREVALSELGAGVI